MLDLIIRQAKIVDGTGAPAFIGDIGVSRGEIVQIAPALKETAEKEIPADGLMAAPGFIDAHSHDDVVFRDDPMNLPKLMQGVTTVIVGNCGFGVAPSTEENRMLLRDYNAPIFGSRESELIFQSFTEYIAYMQTIPKAQNVAMLLPHGSVAIAVNGFSDKALSEEQMQAAEAYIRDVMDAGALGMSLGLMYAPGCYASTDELHRMCGSLEKYGGIVSIHMKSESNCFERSLADAAELSRHCRIPVQISHFKHVGKQFWGNMKRNLDLLRMEMENGADLSCDMYPYTMGSSTMAILFPTEHLKRGVKPLVESLHDPNTRSAIRKALLDEDWGDKDNLSILTGWENVVLSSAVTPQNQSYMGLSIQEIARRRGVSGEDAMMDLYMEENGEAMVLLHHIHEQDMRDVLLSEYSMPASDGLPGAKLPHPRIYGTFPRFLREFVREHQLLTWEAAIMKMTSVPARRFGLGKRGELRVGYAADITLFDPQKISDTATCENPKSYAEGIEYVMVKGSIVVENGVPLGVYPGEILKRAPKKI